MTSLGIGSVVLDPAQVATSRTALEINDGPIRVSNAGIDWGDAAITAYEANMQRWGAVPVSFRVPNRQITIPLMVGADMGLSGVAFQTALAELREKVALFQREGGWLGRSSANGTNLYADIVNATLQEPDQYGEVAGLEPPGSLVLECLPDFYGDSVTLDPISASGVTQAVLQQGGVQAVIAGDHPGRAHIQVTDASGHAQNGLLWGFRSRYYSSASTAALWYSAASSLTPDSGASVASLSGASGGHAITSNSITNAYTPVCQSASLTHVGSYGVWARCYSTTAGMTAQMAWNVGDLSHGLIMGSEVPLPGTNAFYLLNLGQVNLATPPLGNPQWGLQIGGLGTGSGQNLSVDTIILIPLDEAGGYLQGTVTASDPVIPASGLVDANYRGAWRSTGTSSVYAPVGLTFGDLPRIPPSGVEGRAVQLLVEPSRGDLQSNADSSDSDSFTVQVSYRPSYLHRL